MPCLTIAMTHSRMVQPCICRRSRFACCRADCDADDANKDGAVADEDQQVSEWYDFARRYVHTWCVKGMRADEYPRNHLLRVSLSIAISFTY